MRVTLNPHRSTDGPSHNHPSPSSFRAGPAYRPAQWRTDAMMVRVIRFELAVVQLHQPEQGRLGGGRFQSADNKPLPVQHGAQAQDFPAPVLASPAGQTVVHGLRQFKRPQHCHRVDGETLTRTVARSATIPVGDDAHPDNPMPTATTPADFRNDLRLRPSDASLPRRTFMAPSCPVLPPSQTTPPYPAMAGVTPAIGLTPPTRMRRSSPKETPSDKTASDRAPCRRRTRRRVNWPWPRPAGSK